MNLTARFVMVAGFAALLAGGMVGGAPPEGETVGSDTCAGCHEETVAAFQKTSHANAPGWKQKQSCESCHGPGAAHAESGDPAQIIRPQSLAPEEASEQCLTCHTEQKGQVGFKKSMHSMNEVGCVDCHSPHLTTVKMLRGGGIELCANCHQAIVGQFDLPRSHPLSDFDSGCANCHDPHGASNRRMLRKAGNDTCASCHIDKAGPFLFNHDVSIVDGCRACHQVHGSPNRHLLTQARQINLCYQCHPGTTTPSWHSASNFLNEKCTACHTAIHGSQTHEFFLEE